MRVPGVDVSKQARRLKLLEVTPELLIEWFKDMSTPRIYVQRGFPDDAKVVGCHWDQEYRRILITIESDAFKPRYSWEVLEIMPSPEFTTYELQFGGDGELHTRGFSQ